MTLSYDKLNNLGEDEYRGERFYYGLFVSPENKSIYPNQQLDRKIESEITDSINNKKPITIEIDYIRRNISDYPVDVLFLFI